MGVLFMFIFIFRSVTGWLPGVRENLGGIAQIKLQREPVLGIGGSCLNHHTETAVVSDAGLQSKITCDLCCDTNPSHLFLSDKFPVTLKMSSKQNHLFRLKPSLRSAL